MPVLLSCDLLSHLSNLFEDLEGLLPEDPDFLLLAYMALGHLRRVERRRFESPGGTWAG